MNNAIADSYLEKIRRRPLSERELKEAIYAAIRSDNAKLLKSCMGKLPADEKYWGEDKYPTFFAIREMASSLIISILLENGYKLPYYPELLPFQGSPEEAISLLMKDKGIGRKEAVSSLLHYVDYYIDVMSAGYSCFRVPFRINPDDEYEPGFFSYLDSWLSEFIAFLEKTDSYGEGSPFISVGAIANHPELIGTFKSIVNTRFFDRNKIGWYMNKALEGDNEEAFGILLEMADEAALQNIGVYPRTNMKLLNQLFDNDILIPGTCKAYEAFWHYIAIFRKVDEQEEPILRAIMHPSYSNWRDESGNTLLMHAISNKDFAPYLYPVLVTSSENLNARNKDGRTALYYLAKTDYPECIVILMDMGAIPFCIDEKGDNVLHVLLSGNALHTIDDIEYCMGFLPKCLITMKNAEGKTPLDIFLDKLSES